MGLYLLENCHFTKLRKGEAARTQDLSPQGEMRRACQANSEVAFGS